MYPGARTIYATAMAVALKRSQLPYDGYEFIAGLVRALDVPDAGHKVRLMPPAYVKRQKNDATDAEAICEAVGRPNMRFVETKAPEQQGCLTLHRTRHSFIRQQTSVINAIRAHEAAVTGYPLYIRFWGGGADSFLLVLSFFRLRPEPDIGHSFGILEKRAWNADILKA